MDKDSDLTFQIIKGLTLYRDYIHNLTKAKKEQKTRGRKKVKGKRNRNHNHNLNNPFFLLN